MSILMPPLPKFRQKNEQKYTPKIMEYLKTTIPSTFVAEIKYTNSDTIPKSSLRPHQHLFLKSAKHSTIIHKIKDTGSRNPCDLISFTHTPAFVVVYFHKHKTLLVIDIDDWNGARYDQKKYHYKAVL